MRRVVPVRGLWWRIPAALVLLLWLGPAFVVGSAVACAVVSLVWVILNVQRLALWAGDL
jgi:hypothetical protein